MNFFVASFERGIEIDSKIQIDTDHSIQFCLRDLAHHHPQKEHFTRPLL